MHKPFLSKGMRKAVCLLFILSLVIITCCTDNEYRKQLVGIEYLLKKQRNDEACKLLNEMNPDVLENDDNSLALYWFMKMQADVRLGNPIYSVEPLRHSEIYYEKVRDEERLVWVYYYFGFILDDLGKDNEAVIYLKKAEQLAIKRKDQRSDILHHIYQCLTYINLNAKEYNLAKKYGKEAFKYACYSHDLNDQACDLLNLAAIYGEIGKNDSSSYCVHKIELLLDSIPEHNRSKYYASIGVEYMNVDSEKAKKYLLMAVRIGDEPYSYKALAQIYQKEGNKEKANEMWHKALQTTNLSLKANVVKGMAKAKTEEGDYKAGQQELFEKEVANEQLRQKHGRAAWAIAALLLAIAFLAVWTVQKKQKNRQLVEALDEELTEREKAMKQQAAKIEQLQQENEKKIQELNRLSHDMKDFEQKHEKQLAEGQQLYESITVNRGNTLKWGKKDFANFVLYYKLKHPEFVNHLENERSELTPRQKTFFILYDMGMTDEDVMRTLVLTGSSVRSNKSRLKFDEMMGVEKQETPSLQEE